MCTGCNTKGAALSRDFKWPPRSFSGMSAQWQQDFWLGITDKELNPSQLEEYIVNKLTLKKIESDHAKIGGRWLPLSKWERDGFDITAIKMNCDKTKRWNRDFGCWTYRPEIEEAWHETVEKVWHNDLVQYAVSTFDAMH